MCIRAHAREASLEQARQPGSNREAQAGSLVDHMRRCAFTEACFWDLRHGRKPPSLSYITCEWGDLVDGSCRYVSLCTCSHPHIHEASLHRMWRPHSSTRVVAGSSVDRMRAQGQTCSGKVRMCDCIAHMKHANLPSSRGGAKGTTIV